MKPNPSALLWVGSSLDKGIIIEKPKKNWGRKTPQESGFLTVQRYKSSPYIAIGESNRYIYMMMIMINIKIFIKNIWI